MDINAYLQEKKKLIDSALEKYVPREFKKKNLENLLGKEKYSFDIVSSNKTISEPIWDFLDRGGKRWRPALFLLLTEALGGDMNKVMDFVVLIELIHNGTIIIDDIEDDSSIRRGKPCLHRIYGEDISINVGNALYFIPLKVIVDSDFDISTKGKVFEIYS